MLREAYSHRYLFCGFGKWKMLKNIYIERIEMGLKNGMFGILVFWKNTL